jgi:hypothetical protein
MGLDHLLFPRPEEPILFQDREPVDARCPACGSEDVKRYPVLHAGVPAIATKCQDCLHRLALEDPEPSDNWPPFQPATLDWDGSPVESRRRAPGA